jgi:hypothetical protein
LLVIVNNHLYLYAAICLIYFFLAAPGIAVRVVFRYDLPFSDSRQESLSNKQGGFLLLLSEFRGTQLVDGTGSKPSSVPR